MQLAGVGILVGVRGVPAGKGAVERARADGVQLVGELVLGGARRLARETATSTMAVYTHFGGMGPLVSEVAAEGFRRLIARVGEVPPSDDPVEDLRLMAVAYRANALDNRYLYAVMFGSASLGGYRPEPGPVAAEAFAQLREAVERAMAGGPLRAGDPRRSPRSSGARCTAT